MICSRFHSALRVPRPVYLTRRRGSRLHVLVHRLVWLTLTLRHEWRAFARLQMLLVCWYLMPGSVNESAGLAEVHGFALHSPQKFVPCQRAMTAEVDPDLSILLQSNNFLRCPLLGPNCTKSDRVFLCPLGLRRPPPPFVPNQLTDGVPEDRKTFVFCSAPECHPIIGVAITSLHQRQKALSFW